MKLKHYKLLYNFAFHCNLHPYAKVGAQVRVRGVQVGWCRLTLL